MEKILIVDDNAKNIQVMGCILSEQNYEIEYALDGVEAIEMVDGEEFDLILMDVMMPNMDGFEACRKIKQKESASEIPIIFTTAKCDLESVTYGFTCGGVDYILKPFNPSELIARVSTHLALKASKDQLRDVNTELNRRVEQKTIELQKSNNQLKKVNAELESLDATKSQFLKIISHEIRTPLNGIIGFVSLLKDKYLNDKVKVLFDSLSSSCKRLEYFSLRAIAISELHSRKAGLLNKESIDTKELFEKVLLEKDKDEWLEMNRIETGVEESVIIVDVNYFTRCLLIILHNALVHSSEDSIVTIKGSIKNSIYCIEVMDCGNGFSEGLLNTEIKPFVSPEHVNGNPGLDLYLCRLILEAHNGKMSIFNSKNGGVVKLELPV